MGQEEAFEMMAMVVGDGLLCIYMLKLTKLYTLNTCSSFNVNSASTKLSK